MEGVNNEGTSADPPMTPIERQMQVIATSIQDLARETTRQNKELWQAIKKGPLTPLDNNQPPPQRESRTDDQEADNRRMTHLNCKDNEEGPDNKTARLEEELHEMKKQMGDMKNSLKAKATRNLDNLVHWADSPFIPRIVNFPLPARFKMEEESLRAYVHRFNKETMQIDRPKEDVTLTAFMAGLRKGDFLYDLCKDPPETLSKLMYEAQKHMNAENAIESRDDPPPKRRKDIDDRKHEPTKQKIRSNPDSQAKNLYCRFHRDHDHLTENCMALKVQVETLIRQGKLQKYVSRPPNACPPKAQGSKERTKNLKPGPVGEIRTIVGGPTVGGISRTFRKAYARQVHNILVVQRPPKNIRLDDQIISFSEEDARGTHQPHDDALVITMNIVGFTTRRVMVDNGSSADILYLLAYHVLRHHRTTNTQLIASSNLYLPPPYQIPNRTRNRRSQRRSNSSQRMLSRLVGNRKEESDNDNRRTKDFSQAIRRTRHNHLRRGMP
uniref:Retrotransposon gag domain-containing protein n=1 Tax=Fagus sylvatica TaxID=28930 RepID=A0A2N9HGN0_FAGSY